MRHSLIFWTEYSYQRAPHPHCFRPRHKQEPSKDCSPVPGTNHSNSIAVSILSLKRKKRLTGISSRIIATSVSQNKKPKGFKIER